MKKLRIGQDPNLCQVVLWTLATLRSLPVDILGRNLNVARLTVDATVVLDDLVSEKIKNQKA